MKTLFSLSNFRTKESDRKPSERIKITNRKQMCHAVICYKKYNNNYQYIKTNNLIKETMLQCYNYYYDYYYMINDIHSLYIYTSIDGDAYWYEAGSVIDRSIDECVASGPPFAPSIRYPVYVCVRNLNMMMKHWKTWNLRRRTTSDLSFCYRRKIMIWMVIVTMMLVIILSLHSRIALMRDYWFSK